MVLTAQRSGFSGPAAKTTDFWAWRSRARRSEPVALVATRRVATRATDSLRRACDLAPSWAGLQLFAKPPPQKFLSLTSPQVPSAQGVPARLLQILHYFGLQVLANNTSQQPANSPPLSQNELDFFLCLGAWRGWFRSLKNSLCLSLNEGGACGVCCCC